MVQIEKREAIESGMMHNQPSAVNVILAKERTLLARERNSVGLAQLALGIAAFGFVIIRFFTDAGYEWFIFVGLGFVLVSSLLFYHAFKEYVSFKHKLDKLHDLRGHLDTVYIEEIE